MGGGGAGLIVLMSLMAPSPNPKAILLSRKRKKKCFFLNDIKKGGGVGGKGLAIKKKINVRPLMALAFCGFPKAKKVIFLWPGH